MHLVLAGRNATALQAVARHCRDIGVAVFVVPTDVTNASKVAELASAAASFGQIDGWVSNAGVGAVGKPTNHLNQSGWTHQRRPRRYSDLPEAGPRDLREHDFTGRVSRGAYASAYSASKFGLKGFSEALRVELSDYPDIHVCDIYPSFMDTPGISHGANYTGKKLSAPPPVYDARKRRECDRACQRPSGRHHDRRCADRSGKVCPFACPDVDAPFHEPVHANLFQKRRGCADNGPKSLRSVFKAGRRRLAFNSPTVRGRSRCRDDFDLGDRDACGQTWSTSRKTPLPLMRCVDFSHQHSCRNLINNLVPPNA
jgi:NAD(P)-dependent dehydrogenase (short-subunit alcohol dehydrogenase family)